LLVARFVMSQYDPPVILDFSIAGY